MATSSDMPAITLHPRPGVRTRTVQTSVRTYCFLNNQSGCFLLALRLITLSEDHENRADCDDPVAHLTGRHSSPLGVCHGGTSQVPARCGRMRRRFSVVAYHYALIFSTFACSWLIFPPRKPGYIAAMITRAHRLSSNISLIALREGCRRPQNAQYTWKASTNCRQTDTGDVVSTDSQVHVMGDAATILVSCTYVCIHAKYQDHGYCGPALQMVTAARSSHG
jgi:hypothetical protein